MHLPQPLLIQPKSTRRLALPAVLGQQPNCSIPLEVAKVRFLLVLSLTGFHGLQSKGAERATSGTNAAPGAGRGPTR